MSPISLPWAGYRERRAPEPTQCFERLTRVVFKMDYLIHPHQRCGYSDSPFARIYFFYTAGSRNGFEGMEPVCFRARKHVNPITYFFLIEKYIEDVRQDRKHVPDLLESIMKPKDLVKEELRQKLFKMSQIRSKIKKIRVSTFWIPEIRSFRAAGQCQPSH